MTTDHQPVRPKAWPGAPEPWRQEEAQAFRTPLNAVIVLADTLLSDADQPLTDRQAEAVAAIRTAGLRLLGLVETPQDESDPDFGTSASDLAPEIVDPARMIRRLHDILRARIEARGATLCEPVVLTDDCAAADRTLLRRIVYAQTARVLAACRRGAEIATEVRRGRDFIEIAIAARQPTSPRRSASSSAPFTSTVPDEAPPLRGIGLSAARRLALSLNGRLEHGRLSSHVHGDFDPGLVLMLPPATRPAAPTRPGAQGRQRPLILYIEDHPANVLVMRRVLDALCPCDLYVGETGSLGLAMAGDLRPDVILLDLNLPDLDGFQVKSRLSGDPATRDIPVIAVTANAGPDDLKAGLHAGFLDYVTKPIDIAALVAALALALGPDRIGRRRAA
ncbi:response regulator [Brevundimonas sp. VNH65]|uniref:ATP-binding response regulator n=1 Tax=Brevundimonas sp. VNH65 TaxID=3400917 RepID=UPI003BFD6D66